MLFDPFALTKAKNVFVVDCNVHKMRVTCAAKTLAGQIKAQLFLAKVKFELELGQIANVGMGQVECDVQVRLATQNALRAR